MLTSTVIFCCKSCVNMLVCHCVSVSGPVSFFTRHCVGDNLQVCSQVTVLQALCQCIDVTVVQALCQCIDVTVVQALCQCIDVTVVQALCQCVDVTVCGAGPVSVY